MQVFTQLWRYVYAFFVAYVLGIFVFRVLLRILALAVLLLVANFLAPAPIARLDSENLKIAVGVSTIVMLVLAAWLNQSHKGKLGYIGLTWSAYVVGFGAMELINGTVSQVYFFGNLFAFAVVALVWFTSPTD